MTNKAPPAGKKLPNAIPPPGTPEFAHWICSHLLEMTALLRDTVGAEHFDGLCAVAVGVKYARTNEKAEAEVGMVVNARGNIEAAAKMVADIIDIAAANLVKMNTQAGLTHEAALRQVLAHVQEELVLASKQTMERS